MSSMAKSCWRRPAWRRLFRRFHRGEIARQGPQRIDRATEDLERRALLVLVLQPERALGHVGPRAGRLVGEVAQTMGGGQHDVRLDELPGAFDDRARVLVGRVGDRQQADPFERRQARIAGGRLGRRGVGDHLRQTDPTVAPARARRRVDEDGRLRRAEVSDKRQRADGEAQCAHANPPTVAPDRRGRA